MRKTMIRFFTIADYEEEELWLREQHKSGWKLSRMTPPCFYTFEACPPEDVIYRLDFKNAGQNEDYTQLASDFGWEACGQCMGWLYFRRPALDAREPSEEELFSDGASKVDMVRQIVRTRFVPLAIIFLFAVIPNLLNAVRGSLGSLSGFFGWFFGIMFVVYVYLILHCGRKLREIRDRYQK